MNCRFFALAWTCLAPAALSKELEYPAVWDVDDDPSIALDFDWLEIDPGFGGGPFRTRALGGSVPGPTIKLSAGTTLRVRFRNLLEDQPDSLKTTDPGRFNLYGDPDVANLHFHGGHVSSVLPADDTTLVVHPGHEYNFTVPFPADHAPGLHWVHPHHHGSSTLHLVGGAALALIVKDPPGSLPREVADAEERVLVMQDWDVNEAKNVARKAGDDAFAASLATIEGAPEVGNRFVTVNGMYQPTMTVDRGAWQRWRILYAGWQDLPLNLAMETNEAGCEFQLLAKDGIFIADYPREIAGDIPLPPGGRADFMMRCSDVGSARFVAMTRYSMEVVSRAPADGVTAEARDAATGMSLFSDEGPASAELTAWKPPSYPDYLQSVMETTPTDGCTCPYELNGYGDTSRLNGKTYRSGNFFHHTSYLGAVVQRDLVGIDEHSYHQHIYPFQLVGGFAETDYFRFGDWHDTLLDEQGKKATGVTTWEVRYRTTDVAGKMMVHCHNTMHADHGMLGKEYVRDATSGPCVCDIFGEISGPGLIDSVEKVTVVGGPQEEAEEELGDDQSAASTNYYGTRIAFVVAMALLFLDG